MNQNTKSFYGENWFEVVFKISYIFSGLTQYGQYHGCGWAVDKGIGASRYNAGIMSAMASQITSLTIVC